MNTIADDQNADRQLQRLAAQRQLYATAKQVFGWQVAISGPVAVALSLLVLWRPGLKGYVAFWGVVVSLCDVVWLTPWLKRLRTNAARIQEAFDCDVLKLPWDELKAGKHPDPELVLEQATKYARWSSNMPTLRDWYPTAVTGLPHHVARLVCQRANCWWDAAQRRRYAVVVTSAVASIFAVVLVIALGQGLTLDDFLLKVVAPLSPLLLLGWRQSNEQVDAARRSDRLKEHTEVLWRDALKGAPESEVTQRSRRLQDEIFENRKRSPLVFDAVFRWLRRDYEAQMNHAASELTADAKAALSPPRAPSV